MMTRKLRRGSSRKRSRESGQILLLCAIFMTVLLLFVGLAVDFGLAYVTRADLGKAVDSAALTGLRALYSQGQANATSQALSAFKMNYATSGRDASSPAVNIVFGQDSFNNPQVNVTATATVKTYFIGLLPAFKTLSVSDTGQATKTRVIMALVLDRSGSMQGNQGGAALPGAVKQFIGNFDNALDDVALYTFAWDATNDVAMPSGNQTGGFSAPINAVLAKMANVQAYFNGGTNMVGGMDGALTAVNSIIPPQGEHVMKVVVLFTDGHSNTLTDKTTCTSGSYSGTWTFGGYDQGPDVGYVTPGTNPYPQPLCDQDRRNCCTGTFPSHLNGGAATGISWTNVNADADYRVIADSDTMRANNMYVYTIGLGNAIESSELIRVANDPRSSAFNPNLPIGKEVEAPTAASLATVFQLIADDILYKLTQ